nr:unnamed protein product [Rangifer tarandus platyrhynchus]
MVASLGWATTELIMSRGIPLWIGAWGHWFDWKYIQMSIDSNISLVHHIVASAQAFAIETFVHLCSLGSWTALLARVLVTGLLALSSSALYVNVHA